MGQMTISTNEASINELVRKCFDAFPDQSVELAESLAAGPVTLGVNVKSVISPGTLSASAQPIDLRGSGQSPSIAFGQLPFRARTRVRASARVGNLTIPAQIEFDLNVDTGGAMSVGVSSTPTQFIARLSATVTQLQVNFASQRSAFIAAVRQAVDGIDTNPFFPGVQKLPSAVVNAAADAAGALFDTVSGPAAAAISEVIRQRVGGLRIAVAQPFDRHMKVPMPDGSEVNFTVSAPVVQISSDAISLTAQFS